MVCLDETTTVCIVIDTRTCLNEKISIIARPSQTVADLFNHVGTQFPYESFDLVLKNKDGKDNVSIF